MTLISSSIATFHAVWFSADPSMRTDSLPQESDGVQLSLQSFISNSTPDSLFNKILITMWYIWKARNDNRFQRKTWTPWQVHHAVAAHITTNQQAQAAGTHTTATQATWLLERQPHLPATATAPNLATPATHRKVCLLTLQELP